MSSLRTWQIATIDDFVILLHELAETTYPACSGFRFEGILFLNVSTNTRRDRYSNYFRIVRESDRRVLREIEVDEQPSPRLKTRLLTLVTTAAETEPDDCFEHPMEIRWQDTRTHRCFLCQSRA